MRNLLSDSGQLKRCIAFDIETVNSDTTDKYIDSFRTFEAPSNYKTEEAIANYIKKAKARERAKAALYIPTQVIWVITAEDVHTGKTYRFSEVDERQVIRKFFSFLDAYEDHVIFGFNSRGFDIPALYGAACRNELQVPKQLRHPNLMSDVLDDFYHVKVKLNDIAWLMGRSKLMSGADVGDKYIDYMINGNQSALDEILSYCAEDSHICAEYARRVYGVPDPNGMPF